MKRRGVSTSDVAATLGVAILFLAVSVPIVERTRELSKRAVCATNLMGIGVAGAAYANAHDGEWMTPPFQNRAAQVYGIMYLCLGPSSNEMACVGFDRELPSTSETLSDPSGGSTAVSVTRAYWILVRSGDLSVKQFICPSSYTDSTDPTEDIDLYYDFSDYTNISYGYLVPFGPPETRPRTGADNRIVLAADKGRSTSSGLYNYLSAGPGGTPLEIEHSPFYWRIANSINHRKASVFSEGQNCLRSDGQVAFERKPVVGADSDNIYTHMRNEWGEKPYGRTHGYDPAHSPVWNPYPGKQAFGSGSADYSTTDTLIYP